MVEGVETRPFREDTVETVVLIETVTGRAKNVLTHQDRDSNNNESGPIAPSKRSKTDRYRAANGKGDVNRRKKTGPNSMQCFKLKALDTSLETAQQSEKNDKKTDGNQQKKDKNNPQ